MTDPTVISAEHAVSWNLTGPVWEADVSVAHYTSDRTLRLDVRLLRLVPRTQERWQLCFAYCTASKFQPVGEMGNERLTKPARTQLAPLPSVLYEIKHSEWLPSCHPIGGAPGDLHHYAVLDAVAGLAWHIAATTCTGQRLEKEWLGAGDHPLLTEALVSDSERG